MVALVAPKFDARTLGSERCGVVRRGARAAAVTTQRRARASVAEYTDRMNGVLWVLGTGAQWRELPRKYPPYQICNRRFQQWVRDGQLEKILRLLPTELQTRGQWPLEEGLVIHGCFGRCAKGPLMRGKGLRPKSRLYA